MALLTNLKKDMHMVDGHSRSRYSRENGFFYLAGKQES